MKKIRNNLEVNDSPVDKITFRKLEIEISEFINRKLKNPFYSKRSKDLEKLQTALFDATM